MAEELKSLDDLKSAVAGTPAAIAEAAPREPVRDALGRAYATGKRKDAVARVWVKAGSGKIVVNGKDSKTLMVSINEARFNPTRWPWVTEYLNRQGMVADPAGFHEAMNDLTLDMIGAGSLAPDWDTWNCGDDLPHADTPATIQH